MKNKIINKMNGKILVLGIVLLLASSFVCAYGVLSEYTTNRPLMLNPGMSAETYIKIQNTGDTAMENLRVKVELIEGSEIAKIIGSETFTVPAGEQRQVGVKINIPENSKVGSEYNVRYKITPVSTEEQGGMINIGIAYEREFKVQLIEESIETETPQSNNLWLWVLGVLVVIVVGWVLWSRKKTEKKGKKGRK